MFLGCLVFTKIQTFHLFFTKLDLACQIVLVFIKDCRLEKILVSKFQCKNISLYIKHLKNDFH